MAVETKPVFRPEVLRQQVRSLNQLTTSVVAGKLGPRFAGLRIADL